jgi:hypothetical protein
MFSARTIKFRILRARAFGSPPGPAAGPTMLEDMVSDADLRVVDGRPGRRSKQGQRSL